MNKSSRDPEDIERGSPNQMANDDDSPIIKMNEDKMSKKIE